MSFSALQLGVKLDYNPICKGKTTFHFFSNTKKQANGLHRLKKLCKVVMLMIVFPP